MLVTVNHSHLSSLFFYSFLDVGLRVLPQCVYPFLKIILLYNFDLLCSKSLLFLVIFEKSCGTHVGHPNDVKKPMKYGNRNALPFQVRNKMGTRQIPKMSRESVAWKCE